VPNAFLKDYAQRSWLYLNQIFLGHRGKIVGVGSTRAGLDARFGGASGRTLPSRVRVGSLLLQQEDDGEEEGHYNCKRQ